MNASNGAGSTGTSPDKAATPGIAAAETEHEFCVQAGPVLPTASDARRFPRMDFRACVQAVVHAPPGDASGVPTACQVLTRDISRSGMNLLHKAQVFPGQLIDITLPDSQERRLQVMWCRRLGVGCYSIGCRFIKADSSNP